MNQHPFSAGQKVLCVFAGFSAAVRKKFDRVPEENCAYTVREVFWGRDNATGQTLASVRLMEIPSRPNDGGGFSAWRFRLLEDETAGRASSGGGAAAVNPDDSAAAISQAADPTTEPALLALLFRDGPPSLGWLLATNPNTPGVVLHELWKIHPLAVLENPLLAYQSLSTGRQFCYLLPLDVKLALYAALRNSGRTEELESHLPPKERCNWGHQCGAYRATCDPVILAAMAHLLVTDSSPAVREAMANHLDVSFLLPLAGDPVLSIRETVAQRAGRVEKGGEALMDIMVHDPEEAVRRELAESSFLTPATHERLAADPSAAVRKTLARQRQNRPDIGESGWRRLATAGGGLCLLVAENTTCHESVMLDLTCHPGATVRLAAWKNFPFGRSQLADRLEQQLDEVFNDPDSEEERLAIARNSTLNPAVFERLLQCSEKVTRELASNRFLSFDKLGTLLSHRDDETAAIAMARIHGDNTYQINAGFNHRSARVRAVVAAIPGRRAAQLRPKLAADPSFPVRLSVCNYLLGNKGSRYDGSVIRETLGILSRDPVAAIRARVVQDRRLPQTDLSRLCKDKSVRVRLQVLKHWCYGAREHLGLLDHKVVGVRVEAAKLIMENHLGAATPVARKRRESAHLLLVARIAGDASPLVRAVAAESGNTSLPVLNKLIADEAPEVQRVLTQRRLNSGRSSAEIMSTLAASRNPYIRAMAAGTYGAGKRRQQRLAADRCWYVRAMTAKFGHDVDKELLETLAEDSHPLVQECALRRLGRSKEEIARCTGGGRP